MVLTVAYLNKKTIDLKGIGDIIRASNLMPEIPFVICGRISDSVRGRLLDKKGPNLSFADEDELPELYRKARVYVQASRIESFGMSLAEAMACECVPVVTRNGALPEVAGPDAFYFRYRDPKDLARKVREALRANSGTIFRKRIVDNFSLKLREKALVSLLSSAI